uniref:Alpha-conotoxin-like Leo-A1 n=1 Tax=Conus leopardus TaxID=101306 RepID=CA1A1_CONLE|nr:RecName: Full=Alpha-conotoxin-like Leo-A1; Flags: Precursor [Conus leopardus]
LTLDRASDDTDVAAEIMSGLIALAIDSCCSDSDCNANHPDMCS